MKDYGQVKGKSNPANVAAPVQPRTTDSAQRKSNLCTQTYINSINSMKGSR